MAGFATPSVLRCFGVNCTGFIAAASTLAAICCDADTIVKAGEIREKRGDTLVRTLRQEYGNGFADGFRSDAKLETVRKQTRQKLAATRALHHPQ